MRRRTNRLFWFAVVVVGSYIVWTVLDGLDDRP